MFLIKVFHTIIKLKFSDEPVKRTKFGRNFLRIDMNVFRQYIHFAIVASEYNLIRKPHPFQGVLNRSDPRKTSCQSNHANSSYQNAS